LKYSLPRRSLNASRSNHPGYTNKRANVRAFATKILYRISRWDGISGLIGKMCCNGLSGTKSRLESMSLKIDGKLENDANIGNLPATISATLGSVLLWCSCNLLNFHPFPGSSTVEHSAVNRRVASSNLARGANFSFSFS
jgi:hypothetical protein